MRYITLAGADLAVTIDLNPPGPHTLGRKNLLTEKDWTLVREGEFFVFRSAMGFIPIAAFIGALGAVFAAACILWKIVQHVFLGRLNKRKWGRLQDMEWWEKTTTWPLVLGMVSLGLYPAPLLDTFNSALTALLQALP